MGSKKIYITGCARSGTTLLARMFNAFDNTHVIEEEVQLNDFVRCCAEEKKGELEGDLVDINRSVSIHFMVIV